MRRKKLPKRTTPTSLQSPKRRAQVRRRHAHHATGRRSTSRGALIVVSAPSGSGKTTIAHKVLEQNPSLRFSVSATTRPKRSEERNGKDYFFLTKEEFRRRIDAGEFVEWEEIYGELYGTLKSEVEKARRAGRHIVFDIDVKGGLAIKKQYPEAVLIFIRPPSMEVLVKRLRERRTEDETTLVRRLERVPMEMEQGKAFDVEVVNDDLAEAVAKVQSIVDNRVKKH